MNQASRVAQHLRSYCMFLLVMRRDETQTSGKISFHKDISRMLVPEIVLLGKQLKLKFWMYVGKCEL